MFSLLKPIMQNKKRGKQKIIKQTIRNDKLEIKRCNKNPITTHQQSKKIAVE